jgi:hypothetical protein
VGNVQWRKDCCSQRAHLKCVVKNDKHGIIFKVINENLKEKRAGN